MNFHDENYYPVVRVYFGSGRKKFLDDKNGVCRFCKRSKPEATFKNISHAMPQFLGNGYLISKNECDSCNTYFSENVESHFDKLTRPARSLSFRKGKKSIPSHVQGPKSARSRITPKITPNGPWLEIISGSKDFVAVDLLSNTMDINLLVEPFMPRAIYKFFVKAAISLLPLELLDELEFSRQFLMHDNQLGGGPLGLKIFITKFPRPNIPGNGFCFILKRRPDAKIVNPEYLVVLDVGNAIYQAPILLDKSLSLKDGIAITMSHFLTDQIPLDQLSFDEIDVSTCDLTKGRSEIFTIQSERIDPII